MVELTGKDEFQPFTVHAYLEAEIGYLSRPKPNQSLPLLSFELLNHSLGVLSKKTAEARPTKMNHSNNKCIICPLLPREDGSIR